MTNTTERDEIEEDIVTAEISDEALESAAGCPAMAYTINVSTWGMCC